MRTPQKHSSDVGLGKALGLVVDRREKKTKQPIIIIHRWRKLRSTRLKAGHYGRRFEAVWK